MSPNIKAEELVAVKMTKENWRFKSRAHAREEVDVSAPDTAGESERTTCVLSEVDGRTQ